MSSETCWQLWAPTCKMVWSFWNLSPSSIKFLSGHAPDQDTTENKTKDHCISRKITQTNGNIQQHKHTFKLRIHHKYDKNAASGPPQSSSYAPSFQCILFTSVFYWTRKIKRRFYKFYWCMIVVMLFKSNFKSLTKWALFFRWNFVTQLTLLILNASLKTISAISWNIRKRNNLCS